MVGLESEVTVGSVRGSKKRRFPWKECGVERSVQRQRTDTGAEEEHGTSLALIDITTVGGANCGGASVEQGREFDLGPDISDQSNFLRNINQKFTKVDYICRNVLPARKPRIHLARVATEDLYGISLRE